MWVMGYLNLSIEIESCGDAIEEAIDSRPLHFGGASNRKWVRLPPPPWSSEGNFLIPKMSLLHTPTPEV